MNPKTWNVVISVGLIVGMVLTYFVLIPALSDTPVFAQEAKNYTPGWQPLPERNGPIAAWIKNMQKSILDPPIAEVHNVNQSLEAASCPPRSPLSALGSVDRTACMQSCLHARFLEDSNSVLLCRNQCF